MDEFPIYFVGLLVVGTVLLLPIMAFVRSGEARRTAEALREEIRSLRAEIGRTTARIVGLEKALERALEKLESWPGDVQGPEVAATVRVEKPVVEVTKTPVVSPDVDKSEIPQQVPARVVPSAAPIPYDSCRSWARLGGSAHAGRRSADPDFSACFADSQHFLNG